MKVLHVISSGGMYGAEAVILNLARAMRARSHQTVLGVFSNYPEPNDEFYERATAEGIEVYRINCKGQLDPTVPSTIRQIARQANADIVHAHGYKADLYTYAAMRRVPIPLVSTCHTWYDNDAKVRLYGILDRWILRRYARAVAVSEEVRQRLMQAGVSPQRVWYIPNGIDVSPFAVVREPTAPEDKLTVGLVGRLAKEKGVDLFLRSAALVLTILPKTRFLIAGEGPDRAELEALISTLGIAAKVTLVGRNQNMPAFYSSLDLLVSASRQEGLPIALLEGMASALPLVATSVGEVPRIVHDGKTGVLVPPQNVEALAQAIVILLSDEPRRLLYGCAARTLVAEEFSAECMTSNYCRLYEDVIYEAAR